MANVFEQSVTVGTGQAVGAISVNGGEVKGEGGPTHPQLLIPLVIQMSPQPDESALALIGLRARLTYAQNGSLYRPVCATLYESLLSNFPAHSHPDYSPKHTVQLRFVLTQAEVAELEAVRHDARDSVFSLSLDLEPTVAALTTHNGRSADGTRQASNFGSSFGLYATVQPFWTCTVSQLTVQIEPSTWVREVLPRLGYDRVRMLELIFPPALPEHVSAAMQFDKARRAFDDGRYSACVQECRGLLNMWEQQYGATKNNRIAQAVAKARGWSDGDVRCRLLDTFWKEIGDVANAPHHPEAR